MASSSEPARPTPELLARLRAGKAALREHRRSLTLPERVQQVLDLQKIHYPLIARRRALQWWERPWEIEP